jgi:hypothetical protein
MSLVHHEQPDVDLRHPVEKAHRTEALRCDVQQSQLAVGGALDRRAVVVAGLLGIHERDPLAGTAGPKPVDLVLHESDERRDHDSEIRPHERGQLVTERFARAGGHHDKRIAAFQGRPHSRLLTRPEVPETEVLVERSGEIHRSGDPSAGSGGEDRPVTALLR